MPASERVYNLVEKFKDDTWCSSPPEVTSYIMCPHSEAPVPDSTPIFSKSSVCGFGWRFELHERFKYQASDSNPRVQELVGQTALLFQSYKCSSMPLKDVNVTVTVSYPDVKDTMRGSAQTKVFPKIIIRSSDGQSLGKYSQPPQYKGRAHFQITIAFDPSDGLSFPNSSSANTKKALRRSIEAPSFVDTKFYLFSGKVDGLPAHPRALFAKSELLTSSSPFFDNLLSQDTGFSSGTLCDLFEDVPEELDKLNADDFVGYESDSDLEEPVLIDKGKGKASAPLVSEEEKYVLKWFAVLMFIFGSPGAPLIQASDEKLIQRHPVAGRAYAINGTAYKTWKAFIYYTYTNEIAFNQLKSCEVPTAVKPVESDNEDVGSISCSPKSMYRFADYADIPPLKSLAKESIRKNLTKSNIMKELFSSFTQKYQEIIELEVDFLNDNFTPEVARQLDDMLQVIVLGQKPNSFRVLAFTMRRLRGESTKVAWSALDPATDPASNMCESFELSRCERRTGREATAQEPVPAPSIPTCPSTPRSQVATPPPPISIGPSTNFSSGTSDRVRRPVIHAEEPGPAIGWESRSPDFIGDSPQAPVADYTQPDEAPQYFPMTSTKSIGKKKPKRL